MVSEMDQTEEQAGFSFLFDTFLVLMYVTQIVSMETKGKDRNLSDASDSTCVFCM